MSQVQVLNIPVANSICQIIVENKVYFQRYKDEYRYLRQEDQKNIEWRLHIKKTNSHAIRLKTDLKQGKTIFYFPYKRFKVKDLMFLTAGVIATLAVKQNILIFHASSLVVRGLAYVFCGSSGAGKSTVIRLGRNYIPLSDDTTILKKEGNKYFVYPSNFDEKKCWNLGCQRVPLAKIFILEKSDRNKITALSPLEMIEHLIYHNLLRYVGFNMNYPIFYKLSLNLAVSVSIQKLYFTKSSKFLEMI